MNYNKIQTFTGRYIDPVNPKPDDISITDIAHALSNCCRFAGHTKDFYPVAQHSVLVSLHCDQKDAMHGLLHDASEAYLTDLPKPVKHNSTGTLDFFRALENKLSAVIWKKYGLATIEPTSVREADRRVLATEIRDLTHFKRSIDPNENDPYEFEIIPLDPIDAKYYFLARYKELGGITI